MNGSESVVVGGPVMVQSRHEAARRSLVKAISWRIVGSLDTFLLSFLVITFLGPLLGARHGSHAEAAQVSSMIAGTELLTKVVLYFLHERAWTRIGWGVLVRQSARRELHRRSVAKTASWRLLAGLDTVTLALIFTGSIGAAVSIGGFEVITKLVLYFLHERVWTRIGWGTGG